MSAIGFLDGRVLVATVERLARREREMDLVEAGKREPVVALVVEREAGVDDPVAALDAFHDFLGSGHLRDARRVDEADRLDPEQARAGQPIHELCPHLRLERRLLVLEPVAGADVADRHVHRHTTPSS